MDYPDFISSTGYGTGEGLKGWNCRHDFYPFFPGISEPTYTEEQLANIDPPPIEYNGKTLTYYECTQKQRAMETAMRKTKREIIAAEASGDEDMLTAKSILLRRQREEYAKFSKEAGLLTQNERTQVYGFGKSVAQKARWKAQKALDNAHKSDIIKTEQQSDLGNLKQKLRSDNRVSKEYYSAVKNKFSHGSDTAKKAFSKYVPQNSVANAIYEDTAYYNADTKKIYMHYGADLNNPRGKAVTWFHEHGHLIDNMAGQISDDAEFINALKKDVMDYRLHISKKYNLKTFDKVDQKISSSLTDMRKHSAVSDILDGVTGGNIRGCAWHAPRPDGTSYWNDKTIASEAFAHMYEAQFDRTRYKEMSKIFPNSLKYFESKLKEAVK